MRINLDSGLPILNRQEPKLFSVITTIFVMFVIDVILSVLSVDTKFFRDHFYYVEVGGYLYRDGRELYQSSNES